jgi:hypothetical protein
MTQITLDISKGQLVAYVFGQDALAASQTDVQLPAATAEASQAVDGYVMPFKGDIVAIAWTSSAAATAGTASIGATIGGTEDADTTLTVTTETNVVKRIQRSAAPIAADARLGCELTTGGTWDGTSADLVATIYVLHYLEGI